MSGGSTVVDRRFVLDLHGEIDRMEVEGGLLGSDTAREAMHMALSASRRVRGKNDNHDHVWELVETGVVGHDGEPIQWRQCIHCPAKRFKRGDAPPLSGSS